VKLDGANHTVSADFSQLDSTYLARAREVSISDNGDGTYTVKYTISKDNVRGLSDVISDVRITVTAVDQVGNTSTDSDMVVELDNIPPELEIETPESDTLVNTAWIEIKGRTESDATVKVKPEPSSSSLDNSGNFSYSVALDIGDNVVTITVTDVAGNKTTETFTIAYCPSIRAAQGGTVHLPENRDDGIEGNDTKVVIPPGAARQDFSIEIIQLEGAPLAVDNPSIGRGAISPLIAYEFILRDAAGNGTLSMMFTQPIELYLQYQDMDKLTGPTVVFRWDGVRWNRIGGQEDRERNIIKITVNSLSIFGVFEGTEVPTEFRLEGAFPNPFTPNGDGINDMVSVYFHNPNGAEALLRIFDLRGALIRRLEDGLTSWDGLDDAGESVEMGVYVFQIEMDGKFEGGTIILAR